MRLPEISIRNHRFTEVVVALLAALGLLSFFTMRRSEDPFFELASASVVVVFPGADSEVIEALAVDPLEDAIREIEELDVLETTVENGVARIDAEMVSGTRSDDAYDAVLQKVNQTLPDLPDEVREVRMIKPSLANVSVLQLALVSEVPDDMDRLRRVAERWESVLEGAPGVRRVDVDAYAEPEVRIDVNPERLRALGLSIDQVASAVRAAEADIPGGFVTSGDRRLNVRTSGDFESLEDVGRALIPGVGSRLVRVADVAEVRWATEDEDHRGRFQGQAAVYLSVVQREGVNIFAVLDGVRPLITSLETSLPAGVEVLTVFDQSESVASRVNGFFSSLLQGIALVGLVMFLFLGFRPALLVMATIPLAILLALAGVDFTGFGLQQMSIVGLVIALGLLVDDAIVVVESIGRKRREGLPAVEAAIQGAAEVAWPSVSGTMTTVLAFVPMISIQSGTGDFIRSLPVTVVYALLASLALSLTLTPLMASRILRGRGAAVGAREGGADEAGAAGGWLQDRLEAVGTGLYRRLLMGGVRRPWRAVAGGTVAFALALALFPLVGVSLFPKAEKPQLLVDIETPDGTSLDATDRVVGDVEALLAERDEVLRYAANVGSDNPQVYYNVSPRQPRPNIGQVFVELDDYASAATVVPELEAVFDRYPGARISITEFENGPPVEAPIVFKVTGPELATLRSLAARVEALLLGIPEARNVRNPLGVEKSDLRLALDRDRIGLLGLDPVGVDLTVRAAVAGVEVGRFRDAEGEESEIVVRYPFDGTTPRVSDLERITLQAPGGGTVPLTHVATLELAPGTGRIDHYDGQRVATVTAWPVRDAGVLDITQTVSDALEAMEWPAGYDWFAGGTFEEQQEGFGGMIRALLVAVIGIFGVLVLQFRSFVQPLIIFASVPLSFVGAVGALLLTGYTFSFTAFIGITSLVGIVINNSILLVDLANRRLAEGDTLEEALRIAGETRFQPIVLTTMTTVGGLLPLTLTGSELWSPLGWTIIGGLLTSTVLTLVLVPALYRLVMGGATRATAVPAGP